MLLKDKVVIISGIGPGLGIKLAILAAAEGAAGLAISARTASRLDEAEEAIRAAGLDTPVLKVPTDITVREHCDRLAALTVEKFGRIDALFNSAYTGGKLDPLDKYDADDWHQTMEVNLFGTLNMTFAVVPQMKQQGGGSIVMINSQVTRKPIASQAGYATSKGALRTASAYLALELGPHNIRVNSTFMGWMWGAPVQAYMEQASREYGVSIESMKADVARNIALGHIPEDGECAKAAIFLASDYASVVTGAGLDVNGGEFLTA